jgi:glyoxylase-like metal-dependent hydrolase (beta-lactamase superfamily II)
MKIYKSVFSPIEVNTYIVTSNNTGCIVIDCGCYGHAEEKKLDDLITEKGLKPEMLLNTHCHLDHVFGNSFMLERYGLEPLFHEDERHNNENTPEFARMFGLMMEAPPGAGRFLTDGELISAAGVTFEVIAVPGHSQGGVAFYSKDDGVVFTGDSLFAGSIGRSDLPGGDHEQLMNAIRRRLFTLPPSTVVYPGHGPATSISEEMENNPFFT